MIDIAVSDHKLIYCTRKALHPKTNGHKQIKIWPLKIFTTDVSRQHPVNESFPNYEVFNDVNAAYSDFTDELMSAIDEIAPIKEVGVKNPSGLTVK